MNDFKKNANIEDFSFVCILLKSIIILYTLILLIIAVPASATVFISDHFDGQSDWNGCSDPPSPWTSYFYNEKWCNRVGIDDSWGDAHNSGKSVRILWAASMMELGMEDAEAGGKSSLYIGFWYKHNAGWDWGGDATQKWIYFPETGGNRTMVSFKSGSVCWFDGYSYSLCTTDHPSVTSSAWLNDDSWHSYIIYTSPAGGDLRIWRDGTELNWNGDNLNINYGGSLFDSGGGNKLLFGYQSRPDWGSGNISYFDDIIVASTKEEVENFLGAGGSREPSNSAPHANAGDDQTLTDTDGNGSELVNLDGAGSYDEDGSISSYQWKEGSTILSTEPKPQLNLGVGIHTITLVVTDNEGAEGSDSVTISIQEPGVTPPYGTVLMQEFFNDNALADRGWYDGGATNQKVVYDAERLSNVLEIVYQNGATIPEGGPIRHLFDETDTLHFKYHIKYSENWSWTGVDYGPHEFYFLTNADHDWKGPAYSHLTFYVEMVNGSPTLGIQDGMNVDTNHINEDLTNITENRAAAGCNGNTDGYSTICYGGGSGGDWYNGKKLRPEISAIDNNRWYEVSVFVKLNSIVGGKGASDGQLKYWLDGQLLLSLDNILFRTGAQPDLKFKHLLFAPYFHNGVPQGQKFWIDEIVIGTDAGGTDVPSSPSGLTVVN